MGGGRDGRSPKAHSTVVFIRVLVRETSLQRTTRLRNGNLGSPSRDSLQQGNNIAARGGAEGLISQGASVSPGFGKKGKFWANVGTLWRASRVGRPALKTRTYLWVSQEGRRTTGTAAASSPLSTKIHRAAPAPARPTPPRGHPPLTPPKPRGRYLLL